MRKDIKMDKKEFKRLLWEYIIDHCLEINCQNIDYVIDQVYKIYENEENKK